MIFKTPKYLFGKNGKISERLCNSIGSGNRIILLLDYDGTLVPIKKTPSQAVLPKATLDLLRHLNKKSNVKLVVVTGRAHSDIKNLLPLRKILIVSNHGFQISGEEIKWLHPELIKDIPYLKDIYKSLKKELKNISGIMVEDKKLTLTIHFRSVENRSISVIRKTTDKIMQKYPSKFILTKGKKIFEVRPNINWNKGKAVQKILEMILNQKNKPNIIYIGDDKTDEDAFRILSNNAITIRVGRSKVSFAKFYVNNTHDVKVFLNKIDSLTSIRSE